MAENTEPSIDLFQDRPIESSDLEVEGKSERPNLILVSDPSAGSDCNNPQTTHADEIDPASLNCDDLINTDRGSSNVISTSRFRSTGSNYDPHSDTAMSLVTADCSEQIDKSNNQSSSSPRACVGLDLDVRRPKGQSLDQLDLDVDQDLGVSSIKCTSNSDLNTECFIPDKGDACSLAVNCLETQSDLEESDDGGLSKSKPTITVSDSLLCSSDKAESSMVATVAFEVDFNTLPKTDDSLDMPKKVKNSLQDAFLHFRKKRQDEIRQERRRRDAILEANADPVRMSKLREKIIAQAKRYFGVPYAKKYWQPNSPEYNSSIFLDCCGLVRQVMRDLQDDLGFRLGPWNQAYMFDTLPVTLTKRQLKPGDLVFMTGEYANPKKRKQRHNMLHVEIWLGEGNKTIGSRWNNGKVGVFESYKFDPKSFHSEQYIFKSIDTWLMGICHSYCSKHPWRMRKFNTSAKSIFNADDAAQDEKATPDSDEDGENNDKGGKTPLDGDEEGEGSDGDGEGGGGGGGIDSSLALELNITADASRQTTPGSVANGDQELESPPFPSKGVRAMISPRKFKTSLRNSIRASGATGKRGSVGASGERSARQEKINKELVTARRGSQVAGARQRHRLPGSAGGATLSMDHDATVVSQSTPEMLRGSGRRGRKQGTVGDLTLLKEAASSRRATATVVTSVVGRPRDAGGSGEGQVCSSQDMLREVAGEEINYIPNRLPSRTGSRSSNAWRTSKEREAKARSKVKGRGDQVNSTPALEAWVAPMNTKGPQSQKGKVNSPNVQTNAVSPKEYSPPLRPLPSPSVALQSSETNLLFRANTNFFKANGGAGSNRGASVCAGDWSGRAKDDRRTGGKDNLKWRLSTRISPERGCGIRNDALDLSKVSEKLNSIRAEEEGENESLRFEDFSDDSFEDEKPKGLKAGISGCLIIQKSPRVLPDSDWSTRNQTSGNNGVSQNERYPAGRGRGCKGKNGIRKGFSQGGDKKRSVTVNHGSVGAVRVSIAQGASDSGRVQYLSTAILQSAICPTPLGDSAQGEVKKPVGRPSSSSAMPPVDDGSVLVWAGTASEVSSCVRPTSVHTRGSVSEHGPRRAAHDVLLVSDGRGHQMALARGSQSERGGLEAANIRGSVSSEREHSKCEVTAACHSDLAGQKTGDYQLDNGKKTICEKEISRDQCGEKSNLSSSTDDQPQKKTNQTHSSQKQEGEKVASASKEDAALIVENNLHGQKERSSTDMSCLNGAENSDHTPKSQLNMFTASKLSNSKQGNEYHDSLVTKELCGEIYCPSDTEALDSHGDKEEADIADTSFTSDLSLEDIPFVRDTAGVLHDKNTDLGVYNAAGDVGLSLNKKMSEEFGCGIKEMESAHSRQHLVGAAGDLGDNIKHHDTAPNRELTGFDQLDPDTDEEMESAIGLTTLHNLYYQHSKNSQLDLFDNIAHDNGDVNTNRKRIDYPSGVNARPAVVGGLYGVAPGHQRLNPAWEWLYSFQPGLVSAGDTINANINNNSSDGSDGGGNNGGGTSLFPGYGDLEQDGDGEEIHVNHALANGSDVFPWRYPPADELTLPPLGVQAPTPASNCQQNGGHDVPPDRPAQGLVASQPVLNVLPRSGSEDEEGQIAGQPGCKMARFTDQQLFDHYKSSNLLASYVLSQQPKGVDDDDVDETDNAIDNVSESVGFSTTHVQYKEGDNNDDEDDNSHHVGDNETKYERHGDANSPLSGCGFESNPDSISNISGETFHPKPTLKTRANNGGNPDVQGENGKTTQQDTFDERPESVPLVEDAPCCLDSPRLRFRRRETTAWSTPCFIAVADGNNNSGLGDDLTEKDKPKREPKKARASTKKPGMTGGVKTCDTASVRVEIYPENASSVPKLPNPRSPQASTVEKVEYYDLLHRASRPRPHFPYREIDVGRDEVDPPTVTSDGRTQSIDSLSGSVNYQRALLTSTFPDLTFTTPQELSFWTNPAAPLWRLTRMVKGASAKSHTGKQSAGSGGGGAAGQTGSASGSGDKGAADRTPSDPAEGGGDDGGKGGNKGGAGGGNKRPGRPPKLPQCCLPNNMQPTFYIGGGNGTALVEAPLLTLGWKRITDKNEERYRLKWVENKSRINYVAFREGEQLVNHIPNCKLLTNKLGLVCSLQEYERVTLLTKGRTPRMKMADFVPETYKLDERNDREKFLSIYVDGETWICKPTGLSQGKGIFLLRSREEINNLLSERDAKQQSKSISRRPLMRIVQRYINKPMLLDNRKFDIRAYMLIASTVPYLVLFHQGYVRLSCQKYDAADTNLTTHLTNQFVQKKDPMYKDNKEDTAWTMEKFNEYINEHVAKEKGLDADWVFGPLTKQMQRISLHCFNSVKHKLQCKIGYFDLYGLDFMVDDDMKVWLIEINANPALHTNCQALKEAIPPVVESGLFVAVECFDKSRKGQPLLPINSLADYSVLYCGASPNAAAPRQIRSVSPFKDAGEWASRPAGTSSSTRRHSPPRNLPRMSVTTTAASTSGGHGQAQGTQAASGGGGTHNSSTHGPTGAPTTVTKPERREPPSSILPTINIGTSLGQKSSSAGGGANASRQQQQQHHQTQQQQQQQQNVPPTQHQQHATLARVSLTGVSATTNEDKHKLRMTHAADSSTTAHVRKSRDNPHRGN